MGKAGPGVDASYIFDASLLPQSGHTATECLCGIPPRHIKDFPAEPTSKVPASPDGEFRLGEVFYLSCASPRLAIKK